MTKTTKTPRERIKIKRPKVSKGPTGTDKEWYGKAYERFSIALKQHRNIVNLAKNKIN